MKIVVARRESFALLSHLRWVAALLVAYSHVRQALLVDYAQIPHPGLAAKLSYFLAGFGHAGVIVFFVLSGFLVGGKALDLAGSDSVRQQWPKFLADRFARMFIVLWPVILLSLIIFWCLEAFVPRAPFVASPGWGWDMQIPVKSDNMLVNWVGNATLLNEFLTPTLRIDDPLWSLAYEWFYYIFVLALVLVYRRVWSRGALVVIAYAAALFVISLVRSPAIVELGSVWFFGLAARFVFDRRLLNGRWLAIAALGIGLASLALSRVFPVSDYVLGGLIALAIATTGWANWQAGARWGEALAGFSYSLYAVHFPVLLGAMGILYARGELSDRLPFRPFGIAIAAFMLLFVMLFAKAFAMITEDKTRVLRNRLLLMSRTPPERRPR
jgi:peptidoglycan/LPS O-acetylase OafA/YrhL